MSDKKTLTLDKNLILYCKKKNLSLSKLAKLSAVKQPTLHGWSTGRSVQKIEDLATVCEVLRVSLYEMLFGTRDPYEEQQQILQEVFFDEIQVTIKKIKNGENL